MTLRRRMSELVIAAGLAGAAALLWKYRIVGPADQFARAGHDLFSQIYPMSYRASQWILDGVLPLWNPYQYCGHPFLATVLYGVFYPFNFFHLLLPTEAAMEATVVLHLCAAGSFTYLYARVIRLGPWGSAVAALTFMFSGFVVSEAAWFTAALSAAVWLPVGLIAIEKIFERGRCRWAVLLAVAVAMPILSGWLQTWTYSMYAIGGYAGVRLIAAVRRARGGRVEAPPSGWLPLVLRLRPSPRDGRAQDERNNRWAPEYHSLPIWRPALLVGAGIVLGLCLAAVQLLPSAELQLLGPRRPGGLSVAQTLLYGPGSPASMLAESVDSTSGIPRKTYVGMLAFLLILLTPFRREGRVRTAFLWAVAVLSVLVALTIYTPVFSAYRMLPAGSWFRMPQRIVFLYAFAMAILSGIGVDALSSLREGRRRRRVVAPTLVTLIAAAGLTAIDMPARSQIYVALGLAAIWAAVLVPAGRLRQAPLMAVLSILSWDLFWASENRALHPYHDIGALRAEQPVFDYIKRRQEYFRTYVHMPGVFDFGLMPKDGTLNEIYSVTDYEPLSLERYERFFSLLEPAALAAESRNHAFVGRVWVDPSLPEFRLLGLMSVRYVVARREQLKFRGLLERAGWQRIVGPKGGTALVYANKKPLPRAYVVHDVLRVEGGDEALEAVRAVSFDPWRTAVLEMPGAAPGAAAAAGHAGLIVESRITRYAPREVVVRTKKGAAGYLVLTDTFYPGWKATVDRRPVEILRANYLFRAVPVPAGRHTIRFEYDPASFKLGAAITATALCGLAVVPAVSWGVRRRRRVPAGETWA